MTTKNVKQNQKPSVALIRVDRMYESLRYNDYSAQNGLGEIVDNSVEAHSSQIEVFISMEKILKPEKKKAVNQITEIAVVDDGDGMDSSTLQRCLVLGESLRDYSTQPKGIGRFGVGMTLGGISLARRIEIYSRKHAADPLLFTYIDLDEIMQGNLIEVPFPEKSTPPEKYGELLNDTSGTIVILKNCDRIDNTADFSSYLGRTYRKFIERGLKIKLNGELIYLHDPLYMSSPTIFDKQKMDTDKTIEPKAISLGEFSIPREIPNRNGETANVVIRMSLLPEEWRPLPNAGGTNEARKRKIDKNEGVSILRANREVFYGHVPYITGKKGTAKSLDIDRWWGCEISFPPELDHDFQVRYIKRGAEPIADLRDQIREIIGPVVETARKMVRETWEINQSKEVKENGAFGKAEKAMAKASSALPKSKKGKHLTPAQEDAQIDDLAAAALGMDSKDPEKKELKKAEIRKKPYSIETVSYPKTVLFDTVHLLNNIVIKLNVNHPFYKKILQPLCGDLSNTNLEEGGTQNQQRIKDAILLLLFSYAKAESMFENHEDLFSNLHANWGIALATALEEYSDDAQG